jgi:thioredoxin-like negative regulator of GroEL
MSITKIDISSSPKTAEDWNVRSIPTILIIKKGVERGRLTGVQTEAAIKDLYNKI